MVVNDNAFGLVKRGALEFFASKLAPTGFVLPIPSPVGAGLSGRRIAAMVVNDNAFGLVKRGALEFFASKLAPTGIALAVFCAIARRAIFYAGEKPACYPNR
jgi:hypothetical protein